MIHGSSNDPVLIKRIALKVWTLRDEVEAVIAKTIRESPEEKKELSPEEIAEIREEYRYKGPLEKKANLSIVEGGSDSEEGSEEDPEGESGDDSQQVESLAEAPPPSEGPVKVIQRSSENIPQSKIQHAISVLGEINMENFYFFSSSNFLEGQSVVIEFQIPKKFVLNADIVYCRPFNIRSRIISEKKLTYRVAAKFSFLKEGERTLLRQFIQSIEPDVPVAPTKPVKEKSEDEGDDFEGLDGLDF